MPDTSELDGLRIWRYMDLTKFVSLLTSRTLFFACPSQFDDQYEGYLPRSHAKAWSEITQRLADDMLALRRRFAAKSSASLAKFDETMETFRKRVRGVQGEAASRFGVSCWHISEHESDAMWKLYSASGRGIAIESTVGSLRASLGDRKDLQIDAVRYMDFDRDPIEKGHRHYSLFLKRKCFVHENELRATILLPQEGIGAAVVCDLDILVSRIHVSPLVESYVKDAIEMLCRGTTQPLHKPVVRSTILLPPDYGIEIELDPKHAAPA
ncbi:MAG TPA: DUF2971 domain-containing protein [Verrucomicrobiae bacterium]|nr:DUF2971 domain-containing protein [Verrucomicrobiae bacterium]